MNHLIISSMAIRQDGNGQFCLNDLHRAAGGLPKHRPGQFMRLETTKGLVYEIQCADQRSAFQIINGGPQRGTYVCKELVYAYAMWVSPAFCLKVIRAYDQQQNNAMGLYQQLQALIAEEVSTQVRASFGSRLMLERKRAIPLLRERRERIESELQPELFIH
ncbi:KilA-N domain-containing protein [Alcaligenes endophyticus]|uniref:KilA-N domain-containing protein n=1 Tax=Alcaligenes endophyticus TaxID=1929088 RepID=A0ABT8EJ03_9BURK|nr:KilA-N domain-containing protein [Alcaligenes endophyticus]MCX5592534.1 KilA-N domain-containing protein [Alcaligenes endophyticus]MDN4121260.1 KilA-N domain-containing protein [Alcaligenes endophyticus]